MVAKDGQGVLIDYDLAVSIKDDDRASARERSRLVGNFHFIARQRFPARRGAGRLALPHQPWHDIEPLAYVILFLVFSRPEGPNGPKAMSDQAKKNWSGWDKGVGGVLAKTSLFLCRPRLQKILDRYETFWTGVSDLVGIVVRSCGLMDPHSCNLVMEEEAQMEDQWERGRISHNQFIAEVSAFINKPSNGNACI